MKTFSVLSSITASLLALSQVVNANRIFHEGDSLRFSVKPLTPGGGSFDDKLYLYPIDYYHPTLGSCPPKAQDEDQNSDVLITDPFFGNNFMNAPFNTSFLNRDARCALLCDRNYNATNVTFINDLIKKNYKLNFYVEDIPVGHELFDFETQKFYIDLGVPLGYLDVDKIPHLFNHFQFTVYYKSSGQELEILYATVSTQSLTRIPQVPLACHLSPPLLLRNSDFSYNGNRISYDVAWKEVHVDKTWKRTWEVYHNDIVKPFVSRSIMLMFLILTLIVSTYTYTTVSRALSTEKVNVLQKSKLMSMNDNNELQEELAADDLIDDFEFSWPALAHDVFRRPGFSTFLYFYVSLGAQLTLTAFIVILHYATGTLNIHGINNELERSILFNFFLTLPVFSLLHCYLFKFFGYAEQTKKKLVTSLVINSLAVPTVLYPFVSYYNGLHASVESPLHISLGHYHTVAFFYIGITLISFLLGLRFIKPVGRATSEIQKQIPDLPFTFQTIPNMVITGLFPFGAILVPLSSIYISLWYNHFFAGATLTVSSLLLIVLLSSISILNMYFGLSVGNWKWTWFSFLSGSSVGVYTFLYSFYLTKWNFGDAASFHLFVLQNLAISTVVGLIGGAVAFVSCFVFVQKLYAGLSEA
ncbi:Transmembrane 9 superfamily member 2 [Cyberlindnera fabianii]|uniref:Transmembrane 9 superfamily member n=1 Tax=Cyberlindnera fabianii TaxID=36022 RepID=A0A1V2L7Y8_CYBFA|nr:Transmembrane 9 superfamily member 2 [Cyberlindnera fabianii]